MKKHCLLIVLLIYTGIVFGQKDAKERAIVEEGMLLYKSEMASWLGTDLFSNSYDKLDMVGGYLSYVSGNHTNCIFFSNEESPKVLGTIVFESTFDIKKAKMELKDRLFTENESALYEMRSNAIEQIHTDTLFKRYENTNLNVIPLINNNEKKVYVLTAPQEVGVVIFGNDYLLEYSNDGKLKSSRCLHKNIIPIYYGEENGTGMKQTSGVHSHLPETGDYITPTDICTLMLYSKYTDWETHHVVSEKFLNVWNCKTNTLAVIPMDTIEKINKTEQKGKKKSEKKRRKKKRKQ